MSLTEETTKEPVVRSYKINYGKIFDGLLYKSYGYELQSYREFISIIETSLSMIKKENPDITEADFMNDVITYLNYRGHSKQIMEYKEPTEKKIKEVTALLDTYKEDHEYYYSNIKYEIYIDILKPIQPQEVMDKLEKRIQFFQFVLELIEKNKVKYNL
ncbi:unnamed protein product [Cunninghamella blakesleeana]